MTYIAPGHILLLGSFSLPLTFTATAETLYSYLNSLTILSLTDLLVNHFFVFLDNTVDHHLTLPWLRPCLFNWVNPIISFSFIDCWVDSMTLLTFYFPPVLSNGWQLQVHDVHYCESCFSVFEYSSDEIKRQGELSLPAALCIFRQTWLHS